MTKIFRRFLVFALAAVCAALVYPSKSNASDGASVSPPPLDMTALKEGSSRSQIQLSLLYAYSTGSREKVKMYGGAAIGDYMWGFNDWLGLSLFGGAVYAYADSDILDMHMVLPLINANAVFKAFKWGEETDAKRSNCVVLYAGPAIVPIFMFLKVNHPLRSGDLDVYGFTFGLRFGAQAGIMIWDKVRLVPYIDVNAALTGYATYKAEGKKRDEDGWGGVTDWEDVAFTEGERLEAAKPAWSFGLDVQLVEYNLSLGALFSVAAQAMDEGSNNMMVWLFSFTFDI